MYLFIYMCKCLHVQLFSYYLFIFSYLFYIFFHLGQLQDTVEVDNNVTRNVWPELEKDDWDVMILHFLGLDHVGHLEGPHRYEHPPPFVSY